MHKIGCQVRQSVELTLRPAVLNRNIVVFEMASFAQPLAKSDKGITPRLDRNAVENPDHRHRRLLRPRRQRPRRRAAEQRDELATPDHSITSSARASNVGGTSRPSALAVLRLITSSNLVGCRTGKSFGLIPLRILPV